jgi:hypothetical protein
LYLYTTIIESYIYKTYIYIYIYINTSELKIQTYTSRTHELMKCEKDFDKFSVHVMWQFGFRKGLGNKVNYEGWLS